MLEVYVLGRFEVRSAGTLVAIGSRPAQSLLAFLILNAGTAFRREKLAGQMWPDSTEASARDYLRHALWRIRKAIGGSTGRGKDAPYLLVDDIQVRFNPASLYSFDLERMEKTDPQVASIEELMSAVSLYEGELLPGFYDEWVLLQRQHAQSLFEQRMARLLELLVGARRWLEVVEWGERWLSLGQKPEAAFRALMTAHAARDDMAKVAAAYDRCVKALGELGFEPSEQTRLLYAQLRAGQDPARGPIATHLEPGRSRLPAPLTSFVGRTRELKEVTALLSGSRLLTLAGSGGVGKTRLALRCAMDSQRNFKDGVIWVELVGLADGELIPQQIAQALNVPEQSLGPIINTLKNRLEPMEALLVLDNCEHLIEASAKYVEQLLTACPKIKVLTTSRERLGLFGESVWFVPPMSEETSLQLFADRARSARHDFSIDETNRMRVQQICERIDRIPLAIELAAARVAMLSVDEIAQHLDDRFALLTSGNRTALSHQQTMRGAIEWSYELLSPAERILFGRLAVFAGGFTLVALETVCARDELKKGAGVELLGRLVDKSLVIPETLSELLGTRYRMLETLRQFAEEKLDESGETDSLRDAHLEFFLGLAEEGEPELRGPKEVQWFDRFEADVDNLRADMQWAMSQPNIEEDRGRNARLEKGLRLAGALSNFFERNHRREALDVIRQMLSHASKVDMARAKALGAIGYLYWASNEHDKARPYLEHASRMAGQVAENGIRGSAECHLGAVLIAVGRYEEARPHLELALAISESLAEPAGAVLRGLSLAFMGDIPFAQGDGALAREQYEAAVELAKTTYDINTLTYCTRRLGYLALKQNRFSAAEKSFTESLRYNQEISHAQGMNRCVAAFACLRTAQGKLERATQLSGAVEGFLVSISASLFHWDEGFFNLNLSQLRQKLPAARFQKLWEKGLKMSLQEAVDLALAKP